MALDETISIWVKNSKSPPTLRIYQWQDYAVSIGFFQKISDINYNYCLDNNIPVIRRLTGGRGILHSKEELTYSFSSKNEGVFSTGLFDSYKIIGKAMEKAFTTAGLNVVKKTNKHSNSNNLKNPMCFQSASFGEMTIYGSKIIGSAQKRWLDCFLQQGAIPFSVNKDKIVKVFNIKSNQTFSDRQLMGLNDFSLYDMDMFKHFIKEAFEDVFNVHLVVSQPSHEEIKFAENLALEKYQSQDWTEGILTKRQYYINR